MLEHAAIGTNDGMLASEVGLARRERVAEDANDLFRVRSLADDMHHLLEVAPFDAAGNIAERRTRNRIHGADTEIAVDEADAERRALDQRLELVAAIPQLALELATLLRE